MGIAKEWGLSKEELLHLDHQALLEMLMVIGNELVDLGVELTEIEPEYRRVKAEIAVLKEVKSVVQSATRGVLSAGGAI